MAEIVKNFKSKIKISGSFKTVPLEWFSPRIPTYSPKMLRSIDSKKAHQAFTIKTHILLGTVVVIILQMIFDFKQKSDSIQSVMLCCITLLILSISYVVVHLCRIFSPQIASLINGLIQFDHFYEKRKRKFKNMPVLEILAQIMIRSSLLAQLIVPFGIVVGLHWNHPWKASLAGYWLIPKPSYLGNGILAQIAILIVKLVVMLLNIWIWMFGTNAPIFLIAVVYTSCTAILLCDIET